MGRWGADGSSYALPPAMYILSLTQVELSTTNMAQHDYPLLTHQYWGPIQMTNAFWLECETALGLPFWAVRLTRCHWPFPLTSVTLRVSVLLWMAEGAFLRLCIYTHGADYILKRYRKIDGNFRRGPLTVSWHKNTDFRYKSLQRWHNRNRTNIYLKTVHHRKA